MPQLILEILMTFLRFPKSGSLWFSFTFLAAAEMTSLERSLMTMAPSSSIFATSPVTSQPLWNLSGASTWKYSWTHQLRRFGTFWYQFQAETPWTHRCVLDYPRSTHEKLSSLAARQVSWQIFYVGLEFGSVIINVWTTSKIHRHIYILY